MTAVPVRDSAQDVGIEALAGLVAGGDVVALSGAGLSTDSGIPDYRGATGSLRRHTPMTFQTFTRDPRGRHRYWARSFVGWRQIRDARPNDGHRAVGSLQAAGLIAGVITQNVDGLHQAGGARDVVELHGGLDRTVCLDCGDLAGRAELDERLQRANPHFGPRTDEVNPDGDAELPDEVLDGFVMVGCLACGEGTLKPDVVFFGETVPRDRVDRCFGLVESAGSLLVLGSSLTVMSGYRFVLRAAKRGIPVAIVTAGPTRGDAKADVRIDAPLGAVLPAPAGRRAGCPGERTASDRDWAAMQTFLPVADFAESARLLDSPRLGKQRVETLQILRAIELPDYGWANHPAVLMWRGRTPALVSYGLAMARIWRERGFADTTQAQIGEFAPHVVGVPQEELAGAGVLPSWLGDEEVHRSHRSNLLAKDPAFYRPRFAELFGPEPDDLPYVWPGPDDVAPAPEPQGVRVWVVRPRAHGELGACLAAGIVGLGTQSGIDVDATGLTPAELRTLSKELSGRRPAKDLRQLSSFLDEMAPGDRVAMPVEHGAGLLLGEVVGGYLFQGRELLPHRRPARWERVVPRSAARPPATLQDPRALFQVTLDPAAG